MKPNDKIIQLKKGLKIKYSQSAKYRTRIMRRG
jgi:hypothetical protein